MYKCCEFTYNGEASSMYGMFVCDIGSNSHDDNVFGTQANIVEERLPRRITPLHYGVRWHDEPLQFKLIFGSEQRLDRYQLQEVANWLLGYQDYQWLTIDQADMENIQFRCIIKSLTPISVGWFPVAFEAEVVCDCPYGYGYPFSELYTVSGSRTLTFYNDSTIRDVLSPALSITVASGCTAFSIENQTTGAILAFDGLPAGEITILVDNENEIITDADGVYNFYNYFNFGFFNLASGDNTLVLTGTGSVTISGRCLYNVGA